MKEESKEELQAWWMAAEGWEEDLIKRVVQMAAEDYKRAMLGKKLYEREDLGKVMEDCKIFFRSQWFTDMTGLDGVKVEKKLRGMVLKEIISVYEGVLDPRRDSRIEITLRKKARIGAKQEKMEVPPALRKDFERLIEKQLKKLKKELKSLA